MYSKSFVSHRTAVDSGVISGQSNNSNVANSVRTSASIEQPDYTNLESTLLSSSSHSTTETISIEAAIKLLESQGIQVRNNANVASQPEHDLNLSQHSELDPMALSLATSIGANQRHIFTIEKPKNDNNQVNSEPIPIEVNSEQPKGRIANDEEYSLMAHFGFSRDEKIHFGPKEEFEGNIDAYNRKWLEFFQINPSKFICQIQDKASQAMRDDYKQDYANWIDSAHFPVENALRFIPFGMNSSYGRDCGDPVIANNWIGWANFTAIPERKGKCGADLYTFKCFEFGLRVAANRIAWLLTEGLPHMKWKYYSPDCIAIFSGAFVSTFPKLADKYREIVDLIQKLEAEKFLSSEEKERIAGWDEDINKQRENAARGYIKSKVLDDAYLELRFRGKLQARLSDISRKYNSANLTSVKGIAKSHRSEGNVISSSQNKSRNLPRNGRSALKPRPNSSTSKGTANNISGTFNNQPSPQQQSTAPIQLTDRQIRPFPALNSMEFYSNSQALIATSLPTQTSKSGELSLLLSCSKEHSKRSPLEDNENTNPIELVAKRSRPGTRGEKKKTTHSDSTIQTRGRKNAK